MGNALKGKVVLVTGAGKGRGREVASLFAQQGAIVAANDISPVNLDETAATIRAGGGQVKTYVEDVSKKMMIQGLLTRVVDEFERIDVLVCCAEVEPQKSILEMDDWDWQRVLDVNLSGAFLLIQSTGRIMKEKGGGNIILMKEQAHGTEGKAAYLASKAGLAALVRTATGELVPFGVKVHLVERAEQAVEAVKG